ncbi:MAG: pilus assembly protein CpaB [Gaiellaceae bacterium]|jgi:Flp pilus assembly protein CpaB|nr:pilus assembly protein CpaB [Gaiellaceae bacterium]
MNTTNRLWHVAAAVGLALLAVLLTTFYVTSYKRHVQHGESQVTVLVAAKDIPVDTQGSDLLSGTWLTKETVARRQVVPGAVSSPQQIRGLIATEPIFAGEQVTARRFGTPSERGVRAQIKGTQRALEITGDAHQLMAGTLRAGDHVDIVAGWEADGERPRVSRVIVRDSLVLLAPVAPPKGGAAGLGGSGGFSTQLRMSDAESQRLEWAIAHGKDWRIEIRPAADSANSPRWHETGDTLLKDGPGVR